MGGNLTKTRALWRVNCPHRPGELGAVFRGSGGVEEMVNGVGDFGRGYELGVGHLQ